MRAALIECANERGGKVFNVVISSDSLQCNLFGEEQDICRENRVFLPTPISKPAFVTLLQAEHIFPSFMKVKVAKNNGKSDRFEGTVKNPIKGTQNELVAENSLELTWILLRIINLKRTHYSFLMLSSMLFTFQPKVAGERQKPGFLKYSWTLRRRLWIAESSMKVVGNLSLNKNLKRIVPPSLCFLV